MKKRHPLAVVVLSLVTFGLYAYWWLYQTTAELKRETGRDDLSPLLDVLLTLITVGLWGVWAGYRNAKIARELIEARGGTASDNALVVGGFAAAGTFSGMAWLVAIALLQESFNRAVDLDARLSRFDAAMPYEEAVPYEKAGRVTPRARVRVEPIVEEPDEVPVSKWASAPSAPVFESNAPMPVVY